MKRTRLLIQERATRKSLKLLRHKTKFPGFTPPFLKPTYSPMPQLSLQYSTPHYGNSLNWHYSTIQHSRPQLFALPRSTLNSRMVHPTQPSRKVANHHSSFVHEILGCRTLCTYLSLFYSSQYTTTHKWGRDLLLRPIHNASRTRLASICIPPPCTTRGVLCAPGN